MTESGHQALANFTRDPSNPTGYLRHLSSIAQLDPVAWSYLTEALNCYVAGLFKAAAVMVGGAAESVILHLRDAPVQKLTCLRRPMSKGLKDWRIKVVSDALRSCLDAAKAGLSLALCAALMPSYSAFPQQIRAPRNNTARA